LKLVTGQFSSGSPERWPLPIRPHPSLLSSLWPRHFHGAKPTSIEGLSSRDGWGKPSRLSPVPRQTIAPSTPRQTPTTKPLDGSASAIAKSAPGGLTFDRIMRSEDLLRWIGGFPIINRLQRASLLTAGGTSLNSCSCSQTTLKVLILGCLPHIRWRHLLRLHSSLCRLFRHGARSSKSILRKAGWLSPIIRSQSRPKPQHLLSYLIFYNRFIPTKNGC
jgi:hypothetical protein